MGSAAAKTLEVGRGWFTDWMDEPFSPSHPAPTWNRAAALSALSTAGTRSLLERGAIRYSLETRLAVDTPLWVRSVEMTTRGAVPARELIQ